MTFDIADKIIRIINKIILAVIMVIGSGMFIVTLAHVFFRYVMNDSLTWSEELLKICIVWFCLLSASFISVRREHVGIVIFKQLFPKKLEKLADYFVSFLMFLVSATMCYIGWRLAMNAGMRKTPAIRFPFAYVYASIYISFGIMTLYELRNFLADVFQPGRPPAINDPLAPLVDAPESESPEVTEKEAQEIAKAASAE